MGRSKDTRRSQPPLQRLIRLYERAVAKQNYQAADALHDLIQAKVVAKRLPGKNVRASTRTLPCAPRL